MRRFPAVLSTLALSGGLLVALSPADATIAPTPTSMGSVSTESGTTVVIGSDGMPYGTGINNHGQLTGSASPITTLTPLTGLPSGVRATAVVSGGSDVVVLASDGKVYASGSNSQNQISAGSTADVTTLTEVPWLTGKSVAAVDSFDNSIAAVLQDGSIMVAGQNRSGRYPGLSGTGPFTLPALPDGEQAMQISVAFQGSAVRTATGKVYTAGANQYGELAGLPFNTVQSWTQYALPVEALSAELADDHLIVLGADRQAYAAGRQTDGDIGFGSDHSGLAAIPNPATGAELTAVATGFNHTVAIGDDGRLYGIGNNSFGQLTDHPNGLYATQTFVWTPLASGLAEDVTGISAGFRDTVLIDADGVLRGSGDNDGSQRGQITDGTPGTIEYYTISMVLMTGQVLTSVTPPAITGTAQFTKTLTVSTGAWTPSVKDIDYQWKAAGVDIPGATSRTYAVAAGDIGKNITVQVTARRGRFTNGIVTTTGTAKVIPAPALRYTPSKPTIKGTLKSGKTLSLSKTSTLLKAGFNPDATTLTYRWYRNGVAISGATKSTYKLTSKDKGKKVSARIYGSKQFYSPGSVLTSSVKIKK